MFYSEIGHTNWGKCSLPAKFAAACKAASLSAGVGQLHALSAKHNQIQFKFNSYI